MRLPWPTDCRHGQGVSIADARDHVGQVSCDAHAVTATWLARRKFATGFEGENDEIWVTIPHNLVSDGGTGAGCEKRILES